jgi:hypothetical protein
LVVLDQSELPPGGARVDPEATEHVVRDWVADRLRGTEPTLVVGPQPHDIHEAHELAGRALQGALEHVDSSARWWGVWAELPNPTVLMPYSERRLDEILHVLAAYKGEVERNDYRALVRGRGLVGASSGSERVFGVGAATAAAERYADLVTEVWRHDGTWRLGGPTIFTG